MRIIHHPVRPPAKIDYLRQEDFEDLCAWSKNAPLMSKEARRQRRSQTDSTRFEQLVAHVERLLTPDLEVIWNDHIPDKKTGTGRQVDVVSRRNGVPVVMIECRRQGRVQEVKWIHEVIGRKMRVNCPKAILVSSRGFSKEAHEVAHDEGIELRTFRELTTPEKISTVFPNLKFARGDRSLSIARTEFHFLVESESDRFECQDLTREELKFSLMTSPETKVDFATFLAGLGLQREQYWLEVEDDAPPLIKDYAFFFTEHLIDHILFHSQRLLRVDAKIRSVFCS